jgi:SAM-dependent methyltransferase
VTVTKRRRYDLVRRLGIEPTIAARLKATLGRAVDSAAARSPGDVTVLDAGCGRTSPLIGFRDRIDRFVGVDIHAPETPLAYLDEFATVDLCSDGASFPEGSFEVVLSNFTFEHFADPSSALANLYRWLRPGGTLVITTVNRRHPFVSAYLRFPDGPRRRIQPLVKATTADAHPLVGICNDPETVAGALAEAGFERVELETVGNLARAWGRRLPTFAIGLAGDLIAQGSPSRRSTILASAVKPAGAGGDTLPGGDTLAGGGTDAGAPAVS